MKVLGYNGGIDGYPSRFGASHNAAAALVVDGEVVAACEEERFSREKHSGKFPRLAINDCLRQAGLRSVDDVDLVAYFYSYPLMFRPEVLHHNAHKLGAAHQLALWTVLRTMRAFNALADYDDARSRQAFDDEMRCHLPPERFTVVPHHLAHLASAFYDSPFERALCLTMDAQGESACSLLGVAHGTDIRIQREVFIPNSLGYLYTFITAFLGFSWHDEYKVMGLAPYGQRATYREFFRSLITKHPDGTYDVDQGLMIPLIATQGAPTGMHFPARLLEALGPRRLASEPVTQRHMDIAAALQEALEETVLHVLRAARAQTGERNLCMAGGVALNSSMNGVVARSGLFDGVYVHPAAHDAGTCVGAALYGYHNVLKQPRRPRTRTHCYLGPQHPRAAVDAALQQYGDKIIHSRPDPVLPHVAGLLAQGKVVGFYQGRLEWGPRALGNRSILADPRRDDMKDIVNHAVKMREGFRPFAPSVLAERATEWFDMTGLQDSPYMLFVVPVQADKRGRIPAVTHVDGSARIQTVTAEQNPRYHGLLQEFEKLTGVPVLLNTSFNIKGEPIVNTPGDAMRCFLGTMIDVLVLEDVVIEKRPEVVAALAASRQRDARSTGRVVDGTISA